MVNEVINFDEYKKLTLDAVDNFNNKDFKEALKKFKKMAKKNKNNTKVHEVLAYIYLELKDIKNAEKEYNIFLSLYKEKYGNSDENYNDFDELLNNIKEENDIGQLEKQVNTIVNKNKHIDFLTDMEKLYQLAILYMADGKYKEAEKILCKYKENYINSKA